MIFYQTSLFLFRLANYLKEEYGIKASVLFVGAFLEEPNQYIDKEIQGSKKITGNFERLRRQAKMGSKNDCLIELCFQSKISLSDRKFFNKFFYFK